MRRMNMSRSREAFERHAAPVLANPDRYTALKVARVRAGLTQRQLANAAGTSVSTVLRADAGGRIHRTNRKRIEVALNV